MWGLPRRPPTRPAHLPAGTLFQVMVGSGSPCELHGSCTLEPTSAVWSLGTLLNTGVTGRKEHS